jgi:hypothetical protein
MKKVTRGAWMDDRGDLYYNDGDKPFFHQPPQRQIAGLHNIEKLLAAIAAVWIRCRQKTLLKLPPIFRGRAPHRACS